MLMVVYILDRFLMIKFMEKDILNMLIKMSSKGFSKMDTKKEKEYIPLARAPYLMASGTTILKSKDHLHSSMATSSLDSSKITKDHPEFITTKMEISTKVHGFMTVNMEKASSD